jgi:hypothetical protein
MGILDEAIREHLELKRQHGADQSELQQLEDEAFGSPGRPGDEASAAGDQLAEAPIEFMAQPGGAVEGSPSEGNGEPADAPSPRSESAARIADLQEAPPPAKKAEEESRGEEEQQAEEPSATEHEVVAEPDASSADEPAAEEPPEPEASGPSTQEREAIAEQPTEMYDVEEELGGAVEEAPVEEAPVEEGEDDDFWDEKRLSDELDQALEAPLEEDEGESGDEGEPEDEAQADGEVEEDEEESEVRASTTGEEDVLEETPEFLEETPEDDELWFEQKPPKDFDFDD